MISIERLCWVSFLTCKHNETTLILWLIFFVSVVVLGMPRNILLLGRLDFLAFIEHLCTLEIGNSWLLGCDERVVLVARTDH